MHFIDICLTIPYTETFIQMEPLIMPYNYKSCIIESNDVKTIQNVIAKAISDQS